MLIARSWLILLCAAFLGLAAAPVHAELTPGGKRVALVIGNGDYRNVDHLPNAANDAKLIAETLHGLGFSIVGGGARLNLDREHLSDAVREFGTALTGAEVALFYYSGHGLQVKGVNWLVPVDASPASERDLDFQMVDADLVLRQMDGIGTKLNIVLLDACRNNPFAIRGLRALQAGLAEMRAPEGTLISYATQPGNVAVDGAGANSPYTQALASSMKKPGLDIFRLFNQVGLQVKKTTDGRQQPWVSTSPIDGDFFFAGLQATTPPVAAVTAPPVPTPPVSVPVPPVTTAMVVPPPQPPATDPEAVVRGIVQKQACSVLDARKEDDGVKLVGLARGGPAWDNLLRQLNTSRSARLGTPTVEFLPEFACEVVDVLGTAVRETRLSEDRRLFLPPRPETVTGTTLTVTLRRAAGATVVLDVFQPGGTVWHLATRPEGQIGEDARFSATLPKLSVGPRLLTAIVSPEPIGVGIRPAEERTAPYLAALRDAMRGDPARFRVDMVVFESRPAVAAVTRERVRPAAASTTVLSRPSHRPGRCGAIFERAQLGEAVSEGDRAFLRSSCR